jgi:hypothetical protein
MSVTLKQVFIRKFEIAAPECCHQTYSGQADLMITTLLGIVGQVFGSGLWCACWCGQVFLTLLFLVYARFIDQAEILCQQRALKAFRLDPEKWGGKEASFLTRHL